MKNNFKERGITLIALVITIIVLLILAGVTIAMLTGENGLLQKASAAAEKSKEEEAKEFIKLAIAELIIETEQAGKDLTLDYVAEHIHEKLDIDKSNVIKSGEPVDLVEIKYKDYEYELDKNFNIGSLGPVDGSVEITYTYEKTGDATGIIRVTAKTTDENGIKRIIKPDGTVQEYVNNEKEVTLEYNVTLSGQYKFRAEGNKNARSKNIQVTDLDLFYATYDSTIDFLTVPNAYAKSKETLTEEQSAIIQEKQKLISGSSLSNVMTSAAISDIALLGVNTKAYSDGYYLFDTYTNTGTTTYRVGAWSAWGASVNYDLASNSIVSTSYSLNASTGYVTFPQTAWSGTGSTQIIYSPSATWCGTYGVTGGYYTRIYRYSPTSWSYGHYKMSSAPIEKVVNPIKGTLIGEVISNNASLPIDGYNSSDNKWYIKKDQAPAYVIYKYGNSNIKSSYDLTTQTINTTKINLFESRESVRILVTANNTNYKLSISEDKKNWTEVEDKTTLNGESEITLPEKWESLYIKIETNGSTISQITVN